MGLGELGVALRAVARRTHEHAAPFSAISRPAHEHTRRHINDNILGLARQTARFLATTHEHWYTKYTSYMNYVSHRRAHGSPSTNVHHDGARDDDAADTHVQIGAQTRHELSDAFNALCRALSKLK